MATTTRSSQERIDPRPNYFQLGIDSRDARHVADTQTETVHIVHPDGSRGRKVLDGGDLDDYMDAVADAHGWDRRDYGLDMIDLPGRALGR